MDMGIDEAGEDIRGTRFNNQGSLRKALTRIGWNDFLNFFATDYQALYRLELWLIRNHIEQEAISNHQIC